MNLMEKFKNKLSAHSYRLTSQRESILKVFIMNQGKHFNAEELLSEVKKINPDLGLATIYRNLELFCTLGITHQLDFNNTYKYYELNLQEKHHHHFVCKECGKIIEFNDQVLGEFEDRLEQEYNFQIFDHRIKFFGICQNCSK